MSGIEITGVDEWLETLRRKLGAASERVENKGLRAGGEIMAESMREKAPYDDDKVDGVHLREDIKVSGIRRHDGIKYVLIGPGKKTGWRAHFPEFGTKLMLAQPFVYPAFHEKKAEALQVIADYYRKGLEEG